MTKSLNVLVSVIFCAAAVVVAKPHPQEPFGKEPSYIPSEVQKLRLTVKHKDAEIANIVLRDAQAQYNNAITALQNEGSKVIEENKWPSDLQFDAERLTYSVKPKPAPAPEKPKAEKK